jgi:calcineurin-like phosphoesterase
MAGPRDSVIGMDSDPVIKRFQTQMFHRYQVAGGAVVVNVVVVNLAPDGRAEDIRLVQEVLPA